MKLFLSSLLAFASFASAHDDHNGNLIEDWQTHNTKLPAPVSDLSATLDPNSGLIYLIGGCNAETGNSLVFNTTFYGCSSVTAAAFSFDTATGKVDTAVPDAPRPRYRHAAVHDTANNMIWVLGGRDLEDNLVTAIDVYSIEQGQWLDSMPNLELPEDLVTSDLTAYASNDDGMIHVVGGYDIEYNAMTTTYAIDTAASLSSGSLVWEERASLSEGRGDASVVHVAATNKVVVVGGFSHIDYWCTALSSVEQYDIATDTWSRADPLTYERGDKAVAVVGSRVYAMGGESNTDCDGDPAQRTSPTTEVEVLDTAEGDAAVWTEEIADIPDDHFRFPAVAYQDVIYTFGGQGYYQSDCDCFPTRDTIFYYHIHTAKKWGAGPIAGVSVAAVAVVAAVIAITKWKSLRSKEQSNDDNAVGGAEQEMKTGVTLN